VLSINIGADMCAVVVWLGSVLLVTGVVWPRQLVRRLYGHAGACRLLLEQSTEKRSAARGGEGRS